MTSDRRQSVAGQTLASIEQQYRDLRIEESKDFINSIMSSSPLLLNVDAFTRSLETLTRDILQAADRLAQADIIKPLPTAATIDESRTTVIKDLPNPLSPAPINIAVDQSFKPIADSHPASANQPQQKVCLVDLQVADPKPSVSILKSSTLHPPPWTAAASPRQAVPTHQLLGSSQSQTVKNASNQPFLPVTPSPSPSMTFDPSPNSRVVLSSANGRPSTFDQSPGVVASNKSTN